VMGLAMRAIRDKGSKPAGRTCLSDAAADCSLQ
jgi:hypothetical protein